MRRSGVRAPPGAFFLFSHNISIYMEVFSRWPDAIYMKCSSSMPRVLSCGMMKTKTKKHVTGRCFQKTHQDLFLLQPTTGSACQGITLDHRTKLPCCQIRLWFTTLPQGEFIKHIVNKQALFEIQLWTNETKLWESQGATIKELIRPASVVFISENRIKCKGQILKELW